MTKSDNAKSDVSADIAIKLDNIDRQIVENDVSSEDYTEEASPKLWQLLILVVVLPGIFSIIVSGIA